MPNVADLINQTTSAVDAISRQADQFLQQLQDVTNVTFSDGFNIDDLLPNSYNYATVPNTGYVISSVGTRPTGTIGLNPPPAAPTTSLTVLAGVTIPEFLSSDLLPPSAAFQYAEDAYVSVLLDPLKAKLLDNLVNGGYGIETADEIALFNRARDREVEAMLSKVSEAGRAMAARGFPLPPGDLSIQVDQAYRDMQDRVSDASRDIMRGRSAVYVENRQFTIREVRELENILIAFHNAIRNRALDVARLSVELAVAVYNVQLARFKLRLEAAIGAADIEVKQLQIQAEQAKVNIEGFRSQIIAYEADVRRQIEAARLQVELYGHDVALTRSINEAVAARTELQTKTMQATVQQNIQISNLAIENAKAKLLAAVEALKFRTAGVQYGSEKYYALLTSMLSRINTLAVQSEAA